MTPTTPATPRTVQTVDGVTLTVPLALDSAAHATLVQMRNERQVTAQRVADLMLVNLWQRSWTITPRSTLLSSPSLSAARGGAPVLGGGGVGGNATGAHDPSVADTPNLTLRSEHSERLEGSATAHVGSPSFETRPAAAPQDEVRGNTPHAPVTIAIAGRPYDLTLALGDHASMVGIFQARPVTAPFNDHANMRRMATALAEMVLQWVEGTAAAIDRPPPSPEAMITFAQDLLRDEFYPLHARRQEAKAQKERPT